MPLNIPDKLPAIKALEKENIFVMDSSRASMQDIRTLKLACLNLMPLKITTETDLVRLLSNSPIQIELDFIKLKSHTSTHTPIEHMKAFYIAFDKIRKNKYDGLIVTGAPVEQMPFEKVNYWGELTEVFDWAKSNVQSTIFICWGAQAALYHYYGIPKHDLTKKLFGVFPHFMNQPLNPIFHGFDDIFYVPHSRHTTVFKEDIQKVKGLEILAESKEAGIYMVMARNGREIYVMGHSEYAPCTLNEEYKRDLAKGLNIDMPQNYYIDNNPNNSPLVRWRCHAHLFYANWLNYFVYQATPFNIMDIK